MIFSSRKGSARHTHRGGFFDRSRLPWVSLVDLPLRPVFASRVFVQRPEVGTLAVRSCRATGGGEEHVLWLSLSDLLEGLG